MPKPMPSTPALLLTQVRLRTPVSRSAVTSCSGTPHSPKPPTAINWPSRATSASAALALAKILFIDFLVQVAGDTLDCAWPRCAPGRGSPRCTADSILPALSRSIQLVRQQEEIARHDARARGGVMTAKLRPSKQRPGYSSNARSSDGHGADLPLL